MTSGADALKNLDGPFVDTRVALRRGVVLSSLDDLAREVDRVEMASTPEGEGLRVTGNWSAGQILEHLARGIERSMDGFGELPASEQALPQGIARIAARLSRSQAAADEALLKARLLGGPLSPGGPSVGGEGELEPSAQVWTSDGAARLRVALRRIRDGHAMDKPSPTAGRLTGEEWLRFHLRHAELHLSFVVLGEWR